MSGRPSLHLLRDPISQCGPGGAPEPHYLFCQPSPCLFWSQSPCHCLGSPLVCLGGASPAVCRISVHCSCGCPLSSFLLPDCHKHPVLISAALGMPGLTAALQVGSAGFAFLGLLGSCSGNLQTRGPGRPVISLLVAVAELFLWLQLSCQTSDHFRLGWSGRNRSQGTTVRSQSFQALSGLLQASCLRLRSITCLQPRREIICPLWFCGVLSHLRCLSEIAQISVGSRMGPAGGQGGHRSASTTCPAVGIGLHHLAEYSQ